MIPNKNIFKTIRSLTKNLVAGKPLWSKNNKIVQKYILTL